MSNYQSLNIKQAIESYGLSALIGRQVAVGVAFDDTETDVEVGVIVDPASYFEPFDPSDDDPESLYVRIEMEEADLIHKITGNEKFLLLDDIGESMASEINQLKLKAADRDKLQDELIDMMNQRDQLRGTEQKLRAAQHEVEALRVQNYELVAQVEHLSHHIAGVALAYDNNTGHEPSLSVFHRALNEAQDAVELTPQNCLRQIQAEAIERALDSIGVPCTKFKNQSDDFTGGFNFCGAQMQIHANRIKEGTL